VNPFLVGHGLEEPADMVTELLAHRLPSEQFAELLNSCRNWTVRCWSAASEWAHGPKPVAPFTRAFRWAVHRVENARTQIRDVWRKREARGREFDRDASPKGQGAVEIAAPAMGC
jgi:hypothetical protein